MAELVDGLAKQARHPTDFTSDLPVPTSSEQEFRALLEGCTILSFHATRLLEHEVGDIRKVGLRRLSRDLVNDRIDGAYARGLLSGDERDRCRARNVYAIENTAHREGRVCLVVGRHILDEQAHGLSPLLGGWGGEAMNGWPGPDKDPLLRRLGKPALVVAALDLRAGECQPFAAPSLAKVFLGTKLSLPDAGGEIHVFADIPPAAVIDIWQPGHAEYDRHPGLPQL